MLWAEKYHGRRLRERAARAAALKQSYALRFADSLATTTTAFIVPLMIYNATHNVTWSGASFTLEWLPRLTAIPFAGPLVDKLGAPRFFMIADSVRIGIIAGTALLLHRDPHAWPLLVAMGVLTGMLAESTFVAAEKLGMDAGNGHATHRVQAVQVGIDQTVQVLGPVIGGVLLSINTLAALASMLVLLAVSVRLAAKLQRGGAVSNIADQTPNVLRGLRTGLRVIRERSTLRHVVAGTAFFNLLLALLLAITPAFVETRLHRSAGDVSLLWGIASGTSIGAALLASKAAKRFGVMTVGFASGIVGCAACFGAALTQNYWMYVGYLSVFMSMDAGYAVFIRTARATVVPVALYGTTVSVIVLLSLGSYPVAGALVTLVPFGFIPALIAVCSVITALLMCWSFAQMKSKTVTPRIAATEAAASS